jgi:hypothetical protein
MTIGGVEGVEGVGGFRAATIALVVRKVTITSTMITASGANFFIEFSVQKRAGPLLL